MRKIFLVLITLLLLSSSCLAAKWEWIGSDANMGVWWDKDSLVFDISKNRQIVNRDRVYVWVKVVLDEGYAKKHTDLPELKYYLDYDGFDLLKNETLLVREYAYNKDGIVINKVEQPGHWSPIVPDTVVAAVKYTLAQYVPKHIEEIEQRTRGN